MAHSLPTPRPNLPPLLPPKHQRPPRLVHNGTNGTPKPHLHPNHSPRKTFPPGSPLLEQSPRIPLPPPLHKPSTHNPSPPSPKHVPNPPLNLLLRSTIQLHKLLLPRWLAGGDVRRPSRRLPHRRILRILPPLNLPPLPGSSPLLHRNVR